MRDEVCLWLSFERDGSRSRPRGHPPIPGISHPCCARVCGCTSHTPGPGGHRPQAHAAEGNGPSAHPPAPCVTQCQPSSLSLGPFPGAFWPGRWEGALGPHRAKEELVEDGISELAKSSDQILCFFPPSETEDLRQANQPEESLEVSIRSPCPWQPYLPSCFPLA